MTVIDLLEKTRPWWMEKARYSLADLAGVVPHLEDYLYKIFEGLLDGIKDSDSSLLEQIIHEWAQIESENQISPIKINLVLVWTNLLDVTCETLQNQLEAAEYVRLCAVLIPLFSRALREASAADLKNKLWFAENELKRVRQTLERVEGSKSDFISVAAHELRTPLTLIEGYTSMLREAMPTEDSRRLQAALCLKGINSGTRRLRDIVDDMIDVSMIDNNLLALNFQPIWLNRIFESVQREFQSTLTERKHDFQITLFPGSKDMIFGDGERLFQAFRNITANAIKYTPDGGRIVIDGRILPGFVEVIISDTGIGIDPDQHTRIFEKFGRLGSVALHSSGKTKFKGGGPGLGLPITKGIVEAHGGAIWVESDGYDEVKCPGSKFHIMLPVRKSPPNDRAAQFFLSKE